jgi:hypothetical protein
MLLYKPLEVRHLHEQYSDLMHPWTFQFELTKEGVLENLELITQDIINYSTYLLNNLSELDSRMIDLASELSVEGFLARIIEDWKINNRSPKFPSNVTLGGWVKFCLQRDRYSQSKLETMYLMDLNLLQELYEFNQNHYDWVVGQLLHNKEEDLSSALNRAWEKSSGDKGARNAYFYILSDLCHLVSDGVPQFLWYNYVENEMVEHTVRLQVGR